MNIIQSSRDTERKLGEYKKLAEAEEIDIPKIDKLHEALSRKENVRVLNNTLGSLISVDGLLEIDVSTIYKIERAMEYYEKCKKLNNVHWYNEIKSVNEVHEESLLKLEKLKRAIEYKNNTLNSWNIASVCKAKVEQLDREIIESGAIVKDCPNCGHTLIMSSESLYKA
jgi:predicted RNA-binding Zn-ribbon protein involved in translation (DUF1610 family)